MTTQQVHVDTDLAEGARRPRRWPALQPGLLALLSLVLLVAGLIAPLVRALQDLAFLTGGAAHVAFLGLLIAGVAVSGRRTRLLRRHVTVSGLVIAAVAMLSAVSLIWHQAAILLPVARFRG